MTPTRAEVEAAIEELSLYLNDGAFYDNAVAALTTLTAALEHSEKCLALSRDQVDRLREQHCSADDTDCCGACHHDLRAALEAHRAALQAIIYASDQCVGHRACGHSMKPWRQARALLGGQ